MNRTTMRALLGVGEDGQDGEGHGKRGERPAEGRAEPGGEVGDGDDEGDRRRIRRGRSHGRAVREPVGPARPGTSHLASA